MSYRIVNADRVTFKYLLCISLTISMFFISTPAVSGWFGYDSRAECMTEEQGKLMSRWINPLSSRDARLAATHLCRKYPSSSEVYLKKLQSMSISELRAERKLALEKKHKMASLVGESSIFYKGSGNDIKIIDAELRRRGK